MRPVAPAILFVAALVTLSGPSRAEPERAATLEHVVERGETLWSIAGQSDVYDDPYLWPVIYKFNRDQITDPGRIYPGQRLQIAVEIEERTRSDARAQAGAPQAGLRSTSPVSAGSSTRSP